MKTVSSICKQATKDLESVVKKETAKCKAKASLSAELDTQSKNAMKQAKTHEAEVTSAKSAIDNIKALFGVK